MIFHQKKHPAIECTPIVGYAYHYKSIVNYDFP